MCKKHPDNDWVRIEFWIMNLFVFFFRSRDSFSSPLHHFFVCVFGSRFAWNSCLRNSNVQNMSGFIFSWFYFAISLCQWAWRRIPCGFTTFVDSEDVPIVTYTERVREFRERENSIACASDGQSNISAPRKPRGIFSITIEYQVTHAMRDTCATNSSDDSFAIQNVWCSVDHVFQCFDHLFLYFRTTTRPLMLFVTLLPLLWRTKACVRIENVYKWTVHIPFFFAFSQASEHARTRARIVTQA